MKQFAARYCLTILSILSVSHIGAQAAGNTPQPLVWYKIDAQLKLDEQQRPNRIEGREQLTWLNDSPDTISELQFHLYLNAFKNEQSTFFRESGGQLRGIRFKPGEWGWLDINEIKISGGEDLKPKLEFIQPDDDNAADQTVLRVPLSKPVKPGEKITLELVFTARLPRVYARTGYWGAFVLAAQWFPKLGVWESVGERRATKAGWNCHQFHANSEFYADFGNWEVNITVPAAYRGKVGATGKQQAERINADSTTTYQFTQESVHDFAWTADANYLVVKRAFKADEWVKQSEIDEWARRLNLSAEQIKLKDVEVTLVIQPEHRAQIDRHFNAAFNAIKYFGLWYGQYPYDTLTVVDPPYNAEGAGGMEYPTLITAGTVWRADRSLRPEGVIVHEFGHQFWYGLVASNEFEESWLDEGINSYSTGKVLEIAYGKDVIPLKPFGVTMGYFPVELPQPYEDRLGTFQDKFNDPILTPAWKFHNSWSYALNSYARTSLTLRTLEGYLGADVMARVLREYQQKWRYRHPASQDFFETVEAVAGQKLDWFFAQFIKGTGTLDYTVEDVQSERPGAALGVYDKDGQKLIVEKKDTSATDEKAFQNVVTVRRLGEAWFPYELLIVLKDDSRISGKPTLREGVVEYQFEHNGSRWVEAWPLTDRWKKFRFETAVEIASVQLDPERKVMLDANLTNNSFTKQRAVMGAMRWAAGLMFWLQNILLLAGS